MKTGKITAKLRDAVPVCLMVNGEEVKRYKNIELPDELKEVEMTDFHFNVHMDGKITFEIHYEEGALPEIFPEARTRVSRAAKAAAKAAVQEGIEAAYNVTGVRRKQLVVAVSEFTNIEPEYKAAPSFAYEIGDYMVDKEGTLTGPENPALIESLKEQGFIAAE